MIRGYQMLVNQFFNTFYLISSCFKIVGVPLNISLVHQRHLSSHAYHFFFINVVVVHRNWTTLKQFSQDASNIKCNFSFPSHKSRFSLNLTMREGFKILFKSWKAHLFKK